MTLCGWEGGGGAGIREERSLIALLWLHMTTCFIFSRICETWIIMNNTRISSITTCDLWSVCIIFANLLLHLILIFLSLSSLALISDWPKHIEGRQIMCAWAAECVAAWQSVFPWVIFPLEDNNLLVILRRRVPASSRSAGHQDY